MSTRGLAAAVAIVGGIVLAVVLFVPVAAVRYRRSGRLTAGDVTMLLAGTVYGLALWTYTLLPLPADDDFTCRRPITRPLRVVHDIRANADRTLLDLARNPAVLQIVLNVALFVPLGFLLRTVARRGVVVALAAGMGMSLLIELTQYTGLWGVYRCAYRYFDVDDLIANPTGAVVGSVLAAIVVGRRPEPRRRVAPRLTAGRRLVALVSDLVVMFVLGSMVVLSWRAWLLAGRHLPVEQIDLRTQALLQWGLPLAVEAVAVLGWGRTVGEAAVQIRTRARRSAWTIPGRFVKLATGVGGLAVLGALDVPGAGGALLVLVLAHLVGAVATRDGRGLSNALAGLDVELAVPPRPTPDRATTPD